MRKSALDCRVGDREDAAMRDCFFELVPVGRTVSLPALAWRTSRARTDRVVLQPPTVQGYGVLRPALPLCQGSRVETGSRPAPSAAVAARDRTRHGTEIPIARGTSLHRLVCVRR